MNFNELMELLDATAAKGVTVSETLQYKESDIVRHFSSSAAFDAKDIIIYVRTRFPNPRQRVILKGAGPELCTDELVRNLIYVEGYNDDKAVGLAAVEQDVYIPVDVNASFDENNCYLDQIVQAYREKFELYTLEIAVYGDDDDKLAQLWEMEKTKGICSEKVYFPSRLTRQLKLFSNGIDIAPYAHQLRLLEQRNSLSCAKITGVMDPLRAEVKGGKTAIQNSEECCSKYASWIMLTLTQEFNLPPVYLKTYIDSWVSTKVGYPYDRLSMYERIKYLDNLPETLGFIGDNNDFRCIFRINRKVYPNPAVVFDLTNGGRSCLEVEEFTRDKIQIFDYRAKFPGSKNYFEEQGNGLSARGNPDFQADTDLSNMFDTLTKNAGMDSVFMTIKNTVVAEKDGKKYIIYYSEPCGLSGTLVSEYFGGELFVVHEDEFHRLLDVKVVLALRQQDREVFNHESNSSFTQLMAATPITLKPPVPPIVQMCCDLTKMQTRDLSYFDRRLRCDKSLVPLVTHSDSDVSKMSSVFDYISLSNVRRDRMAAGVVSAFGTINSDSGHLDEIPVCLDSFKGCKLI